MKCLPRHRPWCLILLLVVAMPALPALAVEPPGRDAPSLAAREAELLERYRDLERSFLRLADLLAVSDPRRAGVLRSAFDRARQEQVQDRVAAIVIMLEQGQLLKAGTSQQDALAQFRGLLELLESGAGEQQLSDTSKEVRAILGRLATLIARQRALEGQTEAGDAVGELAEKQRVAADEAAALGDDVGRFAERFGDDRGDQNEPQKADPPAAGAEQTPGDGHPAPAEDQRPATDEQHDEQDDDGSRARRTRQRLEAAEKRMRQAREQLDGAERGEAREAQQRAVEELETARAELEEILRQVREEEVTRLLVQLEARIRGMLKAERGVLADAEKLSAVAAAQAERERQLEAARLSREQGAITVDAAKALTLLRDDGTAAAIPQALEQVHDDSAEAAARLTRGDVGRDTLGLLGDLVVGLEEMLAAIEKAQQAQQADEASPAGGRASAPGEQPLVDKLSELKMLRSLQLRVNTRTQRLSRLVDAAEEQPGEPELRAVLGRLAERQRAIERATRDIVEGLVE
ncbi:MAG: hypothetical protein DWI27_06875 [Planctomycetota bacterium]|nr:MAG: hypothetical protein DWI27_06875 [Planctomycetota bacterium]